MTIQAIMNKLGFTKPVARKPAVAQNPAAKPTPNDSFVKAQPGVTDDDLSQYFKAVEPVATTKLHSAKPEEARAILSDKNTPDSDKITICTALDGYKCTALGEAIIKKDIEKIKALLENESTRNVQLETASHQEHTPSKKHDGTTDCIAIAAFSTSGNGTVKIKLDEVDSELPIHLAVMSDDIGVLKAVIDSMDEKTREKMLLTPNKDGLLPIHRTDNAEMTKMILNAVNKETQKTMLMTQNKSGELPIHVINSAEAAKLMLDPVDEETRKKMLMTSDKYGLLPIHSSRDSEMTKVILNSVDKETKTAMLLTPDGDGKLPIHYAAMNDMDEAIKAMFDCVDEETQKTMLAARESQGELPTHYAKAYNNTKAARILVEVAINLALKTKNADSLKLYEKYISADDKELQEKFSSAMGSLQNG